MSIEDELIIEMIKGKITSNRLKNIEILDELSDKYQNKKDVCDYLWSEMRKNIFDANNETKNELNKEIENALNESKKIASNGKPIEALILLHPLTCIPGFFAEMGHGGIDCKNEFEFNTISSDGGNYFQLDVHFSLISSIIGSLFVEVGDYEKAINYLQNSINWNPFNVNARFELIEAKMREFKSKNKDDHSLDGTELMKEIKRDLYNTYERIYEVEDFQRYLRKLGYLLVEEKRYIEAKASYSFSCFISEQINSRDEMSLNEISFINNKINEHGVYGQNQIIRIFKNEGLNFHLFLTTYASMIKYATDENSDKETANYIKGLLGFYDFVSGDYEVRLVKVKFIGTDKTYDYLCHLDYVKEGSNVVIKSKDKNIETKALGVEYCPISNLPLEFSKYKEIIEVK